MRLVPFEPSHFQSLISWSRSPEELFAWAGPTLSFPLDAERLHEHLLEAPAAGCLPFTACDEAGQPVGHLELAGIDREQRNAYVVRCVVDPNLRRRGVGTGMMQAALGVAFDELGLHRVESRVFASSPEALAAWEACGFKREGRIREARLFDGHFEDLIVIGILEDEWRAAEGQT